MPVDIPIGEGEHADETPQGRLHAPMAAAVKQHLGIGMAAEAITGRLELRSQLGSIIDLAIIVDDGSAVGSRHRLRARLAQIDDGQPPLRKPETRVRIAPDAAGVGPAMPDRIAHRLGKSIVFGRATLRPEIDKAGYAAHPQDPSPGDRTRPLLFGPLLEASPCHYHR